mgnify:FL=1
MRLSLHHGTLRLLLQTSSLHRSKHTRQKAGVGLRQRLLCLQKPQSDPEADLCLYALVPNMDSQPVGMGPVYVGNRKVKTLDGQFLKIVLKNCSMGVDSRTDHILLSVIGFLVIVIHELNDPLF